MISTPAIPVLHLPTCASRHKSITRLIDKRDGLTTWLSLPLLVVHPGETPELPVNVRSAALVDGSENNSPAKNGRVRDSAESRPDKVKLLQILLPTKLHKKHSTQYITEAHPLLVLFAVGLGLGGYIVYVWMCNVYNFGHHLPPPHLATTIVLFVRYSGSPRMWRVQRFLRRGRRLRNCSLQSQMCSAPPTLLVWAPSWGKLRINNALSV